VRVKGKEWAIIAGIRVREKDTHRTMAVREE